MPRTNKQTTTTKTKEINHEQRLFIKPLFHLFVFTRNSLNNHERSRTAWAFLKQRSTNHRLLLVMLPASSGPDSGSQGSILYNKPHCVWANPQKQQKKKGKKKKKVLGALKSKPVLALLVYLNVFVGIVIKQADPWPAPLMVLSYISN